ncbi:hypothetical protein D0814_17275 [Vibrio parahaemolyticus]|nr:hypothetical protein [Vibrio parahaemolyticus]EHH1259831.1 hypothetical protein [Vibrio parahaemolyticus]
MLKRFYTPTQLFNHLKEERTGDADPWWDDWPSLMEQEKLAKQLIDQGTLHRSVYVGADFVDVKGLHNRSGLYGTACVVPFEKTSSYHVSSLFDLSGNEVLLEGNIEVSVDGYNATEYSVKDYVNLHGAGRFNGSIMRLHRKQILRLSTFLASPQKRLIFARLNP